MYKPTKRVMAYGLTAGFVIAAFSTGNFAQAGQSYDSSNVGITNRVEQYIENGKGGDPVGTLSNGLASVTDAVEAVEDEEVQATETDASVSRASLTDAKDYPQFQDRAVVTADSKVNIRKSPSTDGEVIGVLERGGICLVKEIGDEWTKIASGTCEGYMSNQFLAYGDEAGQWCDSNGVARVATVNTTTLKVRESKDENSNCVTLVPEGEEYYVYSVGDEWTEISVDDDIRGFVKSEFVDVTYQNPKAVSVEEQAEMDRIAKEEADRAWLAYLAEQEELAKQQAAEQPVEVQNAEGEQQNAEQPAADQPAEQQQQEQTQNNDNSQDEQPKQEESTQAPATEKQTAAPAGSTGVDLVNFALQFVGNPYVWGGTSLTKGADCSGFVLSVYRNFGYSLPRTAAAQAGCGREVSLSDLQPGDLCFYSNGGGIGHVAIYAGGGTVVHASNKRDGIKTSIYNYRTPVKAVRIIGQ